MKNSFILATSFVIMPGIKCCFLLPLFKAVGLGFLSPKGLKYKGEQWNCILIYSIIALWFVVALFRKQLTDVFYS